MASGSGHPGVSSGLGHVMLGRGDWTPQPFPHLCHLQPLGWSLWGWAGGATNGPASMLGVMGPSTPRESECGSGASESQAGPAPPWEDPLGGCLCSWPLPLCQGRAAGRAGRCRAPPCPSRNGPNHRFHFTFDLLFVCSQLEAPRALGHAGCGSGTNVPCPQPPWGWRWGQQPKAWSARPGRDEKAVLGRAGPGLEGIARDARARPGVLAPTDMTRSPQALGPCRGQGLCCPEGNRLFGRPLGQDPLPQGSRMAVEAGTFPWWEGGEAQGADNCIPTFGPCGSALQSDHAPALRPTLTAHRGSPALAAQPPSAQTPCPPAPRCQPGGAQPRLAMMPWTPGGGAGGRHWRGHSHKEGAWPGWEAGAPVPTHGAVAGAPRPALTRRLKRSCSCRASSLSLAARRARILAEVHTMRTWSRGRTYSTSTRRCSSATSSCGGQGSAGCPCSALLQPLCSWRPYSPLGPCPTHEVGQGLV